MTAIISKDSLRLSVEAATGGLVTVIYDDRGHPNFMRRIPKVRIEDLFPDLGLTGTFPAFIVNGVEKSEIFISVFPNYVVDDVGVSLPGVDPAHDVNFDEAIAFCANKGAGWHLMTNAEWALLQGLGLKSGFQPHGDTNYGQYGPLKYETGTLAPGASGLGENNAALHGRTLTGSGPLSWRHDNSVAGISDLVGNVEEWIGGLRIKDGEINIIPDNDAAATGADQGEASALWKAILQNGNLASPGAANTLKYDTTGASGNGCILLNTVVGNQRSDNSTYSNCAFKSVAAKSGVSVPALAKMLSLYPAVSTDLAGNIWLDNTGEHVALRGGSYKNTSQIAGFFALDLSSSRAGHYGSAGFRSAFIL